MGVLAAASPSSTSTPPPLPKSKPPSTPSCRIVSEHRKQIRDASPSHETPTMCGWLEIRWLDRWNQRQVEMRSGELKVFRPVQGTPPRLLELRLPLRRMSLLRAEDYDFLAFSLVPQQQPITSPQPSLQQPVIFRARSEQEYERWVRSLAVELMRQTPLEALRFLDVLGITQSRPPPHPHTPITTSHLHVPVTATVSAPPSLLQPKNHETSSVCSQQQQQLVRLISMDPLRSRIQGRSTNTAPVPVRERRAVFESIIAANTRASSISTENLSHRSEHFSRKSGGSGLRARSLLDLRRAPVQSIPDLPRRSISIRELCRIFEQGPNDSPPPRPESPDEVCLNPYLSRRRLQRGQRRLAALRERAATAEDAIWHLQEQMAELDQDQTQRSRTSRTERYTVLERKLQEEERALAAIQTETSRVLRCVEEAARRLDCALGGSCASWDQASTCSSSGVSSDSG